MANPIVCTAVGQGPTAGVCVMAIVWEGVTTAGDVVELHKRNGGGLLWAGRTDTTATYQGITFAPAGISCPDGFTLGVRSSGRVLVYTREI